MVSICCPVYQRYKHDAEGGIALLQTHRTKMLYNFFAPSLLLVVAAVKLLMYEFQCVCGSYIVAWSIFCTIFSSAQHFKEFEPQPNSYIIACILKLIRIYLNKGKHKHPLFPPYWQNCVGPPWGLCSQKLTKGLNVIGDPCCNMLYVFFYNALIN